MRTMCAEQRLRIDLGYNGAFFHGWAEQPGLRTVEGELKAALETILRRPVQLTVAGRTDAGVHARHQVAHVNVDFAEAPMVNRRRVQGILNQRYSKLWRNPLVEKSLSRLEARSGASDVFVHGVTPVSAEFDARFSAISRQYCYRLADQESDHDPIGRANVWWQPGVVLDHQQMSSAAQVLIGEHDFLSFSKPRKGATTVRKVTLFETKRTDCIEIRVAADAFCHSMVRSLVGALFEVGRHKRDLAWIERLVAAPSRRHGVPIVPAHGLVLERVEYPDEQMWGVRARDARQVREGAHIY